MPDASTCNLCGNDIVDNLFIELEGNVVCPDCKPIATQRVMEGVSVTKDKADYLYVPVSRLIIMNIVSFGFYQAYWIYKNWKCLKERDSMNIQPFWRGIFGVFFIHNLLKTIHADSDLNEHKEPVFNPSTQATIWVALVVFSRLADRVLPDAASILSLPLSLGAILCFVPVQRYINEVYEGTIKPPYYGWSVGHIVCIVIGSILWLLTIIGTVAMLAAPSSTTGGAGAW